MANFRYLFIITPIIARQHFSNILKKKQNITELSTYIDSFSIDEKFKIDLQEAINHINMVVSK